LDEKQRFHSTSDRAHVVSIGARLLKSSNGVQTHGAERVDPRHHDDRSAGTNPVQITNTTTRTATDRHDRQPDMMSEDAKFALGY
jgi:hypothetical protein